MSTASPIAVLRTGLVTPVGLDAASSCAAFRAKLTNPTQTRYIDSAGEWIVAHQVPLAQPWRGTAKLAKMAAMAIDEVLDGMPPDERARLPLILCVADGQRPGRPVGLENEVFLRVQDELGLAFSPASVIVSQGRVGVAVALSRAHALIGEAGVPHVLIAAVDSLLSWPTLGHYDRQGRLLTGKNSDGFIPGEAAGALLVGRPEGRPGELLCTGIGFGVEAAAIGGGQPLRAEGLMQAIGMALTDAGCRLHHMDFRITDIAGEQYYFKEAALAYSRIQRVRKEAFDLWHPAECTGEAGAAAGAAIVAAAKAACDRQYAPGPNILAHMANDAGQRAALCLQYTLQQ